MPPGSNNPFGIKAVAGQPSVMVPTREFVGGRYITINAAFAAYPSVAEAFDAHAELLATSHFYAAAMAKLPDVTAFVEAMGPVYATAPNYASVILNLISEDHLSQYDATP